jgi:RNA recognition motif-containing protein
LEYQPPRQGKQEGVYFGMNIYVGNLPYKISEDDLRKLFETYGEVTSVNIIRDKFSGESRGFGFVEMAEKTDAESAINGLNGSDLDGRSLNVNVARPKTNNRGGGSGGGFRRRQNY